nr:JmjC domain-containing protein [Tanacetum cinerariifolium]
LEDLASWENGNCTWGGRVEAMGTIPLCVCAQESWGEGTGCLAGKLGMGTIWFVIRFKDLSQSVLECKKQTVVATSSSEAEYVAAASYCGQVRADDSVSAGGCTLPAGSYTFLLLDWFLLLLVHADEFVSAGGCSLPAGSYSFLLLDWYALTHRPSVVFDSLVKQFWATATATVRTLEAGPSDIIATIDGGWNQFPSSLASALICMSTGRTYNFSRFIMDGMLGNVGSKRHKFLMYPCFLQMILGIQTTDPSPCPTFDFTAKLFSNMKLNWDGPHMPLLAPMLVVPAGEDAAGAAANVAVGLGPSSAPQVPLVREHSPVREPTPGGGDFASSPPSNEAPQTPVATTAGGAEDSAVLTALTLKLDECLHRVTTLENELGITKKVLGGAVLKLVTRVKRLEGLLQQRKRRLVLSDSEGKDATTMEQEFDLADLHTLASATLGDDPSTIAAGLDVETTMLGERTSTTRRRLRKPFTSSVSAHVSETIPPGVRVPVAPTTISAGSSVDAAVHAVAAPSSSIPTAADKGKAPMVDNSPPTDLLSELERVLKNLYDSQLGEELAKKIQAEQEAEFARQQEELAQKAQAKSVASPTAHGQGMSDQRRQELDAAQLIYTEVDWLDLLAKIATNSAFSKQLLGDDVTEENMNERLSMLLMHKRRELAEQSRVKPMTKTHQRDSMRDFVKNCSASVYNQGWTMKKDPVGVLATPSIPVDALLPSASSSDPAAISVLAVFIAHAVVSVPAEPMVHSAESHMDDPLTAPEHGSSEPTVAAPTPSSSRHRRKHIAKKWVTPIMDVADAVMIKFDSDSDIDDDPLPYAPYAGWEMVPSPLGSVHAYHNMAGHTKHFTTLREILHMVERTDLQRFLGAVDALYQSEEPDTFALLLWGDLHVLFQSLDDTDVFISGVLRTAGVFAAGDYIHGHKFMCTLERMLKHGLEVSKLLVGGDLTMAEQLIGFIKAALLNAKSAA